MSLTRLERPQRMAEFKKSDEQFWYDFQEFSAIKQVPFTYRTARTVRGVLWNARRILADTGSLAVRIRRELMAEQEQPEIRTLEKSDAA